MYIGTNKNEELHIPDEYSGVAFASRERDDAEKGEPSAEKENLGEAERMFRRGYVFDEYRGGDEIEDITPALEGGTYEAIPTTAKIAETAESLPEKKKSEGGILSAVLGIIGDISTDEIIIAAIVIVLLINGGDDMLLFMLAVLLFC